MEVIELDSEDTTFQTGTDKPEVILLTDDSDPIVCTTNSASQRHRLPPSSPCYPKNHGIHRLEVSADTPQKDQMQQDILDIDNWLSSSEDDSIDLSSVPQNPKRRKVSIPATSSIAKEALLPTSPVAFKPPPKRVVSKIPPIALDSEMSDPINSSPKTSQMSQPSRPKPPAEKEKENRFSKKEWKDANKATRKPEEIYNEMIVETARSLAEDIETDYFKEVFKDANHRQIFSEVPLIRWKRKVKALYNAQKDIFEPCEPKEIFERVHILFYDAEVLVTKIRHGTLSKDRDMARREAEREDPTLVPYIMIMVTGLKEYLRKLQGIEDRVYRDQMLMKMNEPLSKKRKPEEVVIRAAEAQRCIHEASTDLELNIFSAKTKQEAVDWLYSFTYTIGNALYDKFQRNPSLANIGTVRSGSDRKTTFLEILKKFNLMTQTRAEKLYEFYPSPVAIYKRFLQADTLGTVNGKNIAPPTANAAMRRVFTATDPSQVIT